MLKRTLLVAALAAASLAAQAQPSTASPAKKELIARILKLQQPNLESLSHTLVEQSAGSVLQRAFPYIQNRIPADKQESVARDIEGDARKFVSDTTPIVRDQAWKLAPTTIGVVLDQKFNEDELKQIVSIMESPVYSKFQGISGELQQALLEKLIPDTRGQVETKLRAFDEAVAKRLGVTPGPGGAEPPKPAAAPKAPAKKQ